MMLVYFTGIGGLFYIIFIKWPNEKKAFTNTDESILDGEKAGNAHA